MSDQVCLVTGATGGLGRATTLALAERGTTIIMAARDKSRAEAIRSEVETTTGNHAVEVMAVDLSSQQSVREMAASFKNKYNKLDVLINNAAVYKSSRTLTSDGLETMFATNHL